MANKIVKIVYDTNTWIDMTGDTAVPANVLTNKTFHTSTGQETGSMPNGTAGTPIATKGTVSNNSISVTPSVTNTTGYITGGTKTGTAVTVSASELVSGTKTITASGTTDVTIYKNASVAAGTEGTPVASKGIATNNSIQVIPTVTNSMGFIQGGVTKMGLPVTVSASELVSGTKTISASGTTDVTNYASVDVPAGSASGPNLIISSDASITATDNNQIGLTGTANVKPTVNAGWVSSGTATTATVFVIASVPTKAATTYTPTTTNQTIASGTYLTGVQTVEGDVNLVAENIASGVTIFGVAGSHVGANLQAKSNITPTTSSQTITPDSGYNGLSSVQINAMPSGSATAPASISGTSATVSTSTNTITLSKTISVTPSVTAGYVASGTAGNSTVSLTASVAIKSLVITNSDSSTTTYSVIDIT